MVIAVLFFALHTFFPYKPNYTPDTLIISSANIRYISSSGKRVVVPVQLRARKYIKYLDFDRTCVSYGYDTARVIAMDSLEFIVNPGKKSENTFSVPDDVFVDSTLHDGKIYTEMFGKNNGYDRLFLYYFIYGSCSNECAIIYYYDINRKKLYLTKFKYFDGYLDNCICLNRKEGSELNKTKRPYNKLKTITFAQGASVWHHNVWRFDRKTKTFNIFKHKKVAPWG
jgi:hypothetical protein